MYIVLYKFYPNKSAIILSSDEELGPNDRTPPRLNPPRGPNQPSSSRYYFHDTVNADGPVGDSNHLLNPVPVDLPGPSR